MRAYEHGCESGGAEYISYGKALTEHSPREEPKGQAKYLGIIAGAFCEEIPLWFCSFL